MGSIHVCGNTESWFFTRLASLMIFVVSLAFYFSLHFVEAVSFIGARLLLKEYNTHSIDIYVPRSLLKSTMSFPTSSIWCCTSWFLSST
jgi:hypothetical protein